MKTTSDLDSDLKNLLDKIFKNGKSISIIAPKLKYIDVCYYLLLNLAEKLTSQKPQSIESYQKIFEILTLISIDELKNKYFKNDSKKNKKIEVGHVEQLYIKLWLKFLKSQIPENLKFDAMLALGDEILESVQDPSLFSDVVIESFEKSPELGIVSFRAIYKLMLHNQMQYIPIYDVVFKLVNEQIFKSPYCTRFFDDLDGILSSRSMPHKVATKFVKRLAELTEYSAPTQYLPMLVRLIINLLKRFPGSQYLVHCKIPVEGDFLKSLFELKDLQCYFDTEIRTMAKEINEKLNDKIDNTVPSVSVESTDKKIQKSSEKIKNAIDSIMSSNYTLPELETIEYFGTTSLTLF